MNYTFALLVVQTKASRIMKKRFTLLLLFGSLVYVSIVSYTSGPGTAGLEVTGASGTAGCGGTTCHGTAANSAITFNIQVLDMNGNAVTQYVAGNAYLIRLSAINTSALTLSKYGFQLSVVKTGTSVNAGLLALTYGAGTHLLTVSGINIIEHSPMPLLPTTGNGGNGSSYVIDIRWYPSTTAHTGNITVSAAICAVNNNTVADAGDLWNVKSLEISEDTLSLSEINGIKQICRYTTRQLLHPVPGGIWSDDPPHTVATIHPTTGLVTAHTPGTATIRYTTSKGSISTVITVLDGPGHLDGPTVVCLGSTITFSNYIPGFTWLSSDPTIADISSTGVVTGISLGEAYIEYSTLSSVCQAKKKITVVPMVLDTGIITGFDSICTGHTQSLTGSVLGGLWKSSDTMVATIDSATGAISGITAGTVNIYYSVTNPCGTVTTSRSITVLPSAACNTAIQDTKDVQTVFNIYPNPSKGLIKLSYNGNATKEMYVTIMNSTGQQILSKTYKRIDKFFTTMINLDDLPKGIYMIHVNVGDGLFTKKLVLL